MRLLIIKAALTMQDDWALLNCIPAVKSLSLAAMCQNINQIGLLDLYARSDEFLWYISGLDYLTRLTYPRGQGVKGTSWLQSLVSFLIKRAGDQLTPIKSNIIIPQFRSINNDNGCHHLWNLMFNLYLGNDTNLSFIVVFSSAKTFIHCSVFSIFDKRLSFIAGSLFVCIV